MPFNEFTKKFAVMAVVYARVKFQYQPQADDELPLEVGSVITVLEQYDGK